MATKSAKKTTTTYVQQSTSSQETPRSSSTAASPGRRNRAPSPARLSRIQEKEELSGLNDRLAAYIDKVRFLESENTRLQVQVRTSEETTTREVTNVKTLYETELSDARRLLDDTAREKARLQIDANKYKDEATEWAAKYHRRDNDCKVTEKNLLAAESELPDIRARLADAENQRKHFETENKRLRSDLATVERQLATAKTQLEEETLRRVDYENRLQSMKEDLAFKSQMFETELNETRSRTTTEIDEVDNRLKTEYDHKLSETLTEMREQHDDHVGAVRSEMERWFEQQTRDIQEQANRNQDIASGAQDELRKSRKRFDEISSEVVKLRAQNGNMEQRVRDLENQLAREQDDYMARLSIKESIITEQREKLHDQLQEFADLMDIKIKLDTELAAYRKLLEGEEERLNISSASESTPGRTPSRKQVGTTSGRGQKRKRLDIDSSSNSSGYSIKSSTKGNVEIKEMDIDGKYIKLFNKSTKNSPLVGWQLKHTAGDEDTTFKFNRNVIIKGGQTVTVWSSDSDQTHRPPSDLVMKGQRWFTSDSMKTTLINSSGDEMAELEMSKSDLRSSSSYRYEDEDFQGGAAGAVEERDKCIIM